MKSIFRNAYLGNSLEFFSEIKSGVLSDEISILLSNDIYYKRETLSNNVSSIPVCLSKSTVNIVFHVASGEHMVPGPFHSPRMWYSDVICTVSGSLDPYQRVPRSPKSKKAPECIGQSSTEENKSPTSDQVCFFWIYTGFIPIN
jgi:hypothetical protein